jgi:thiamine biosynthesis lipoprotein
MFFLVQLLYFLLFLPQKELKEYKIHGFAQGTDYSIRYFAGDSAVTKASIDSILMVIDSSMSLYKPYSLISLFNAGKGEVALDAHFLKVAQKSFEIYRATEGKFDITVKPLVQAWGFGPKKEGSFPDSARIRELLKCVGMNGLSLKDGVLNKKDACIQIDLNGIAQGYSVDVLADFMEKRGLKYYVVELGGELRVKGPKPDGKPMRIGIEGPALNAMAQPEIRHVMAINDGAVTTSGNYRKYFDNGSKKITHLIDPKTGYPIDNELISVTLYAKDALTADGYDNAIMAMGLNNGLHFVESRKDMEAYLIYKKADGSIADTLTTGFRKMMVAD